MKRDIFQLRIRIEIEWVFEAPQEAHADVLRAEDQHRAPLAEQVHGEVGCEPHGVSQERNKRHSREKEKEYEKELKRIEKKCLKIN